MVELNTTSPEIGVPILAEIEDTKDPEHRTYFAVIYHDGKRWCAFAGPPGKTFEDGEQVIRWFYAKKAMEIFK